MPWAVALAVAAVLVTCAAPSSSPGPVVPESSPGRGPEIRIGLATGARRVQVGSNLGFRLLGEDRNQLTMADGGVTWLVVPSGGTLAASGPAGITLATEGALTFEPVGGGILLLDGKGWRGRVTLARDRSGLTVINQVGLEDYLAGVVSSEMGRRDTSELEALAAQAVVSRTFAIRNLGKRAAEGFDLLASVADQVYGGVAAETPLGWSAVRATEGQILTWDGAPIDAFFYSTCAGRTAAGPEVFVGANRPYLVSQSDTDPSGQPWCRISPRYRWQVRWTGDELRGVLRRSLPGVSSASAAEAGTASGVRVVSRTGSDRVARIAVLLARSTVDVDGPAIRYVLRPVGEGALRSSAFTLAEARRGPALDTLVADGRGAGHGVGFCQWGAVARARAGQKAEQILGSYFPGTTISRAY